MLLDQIFSSCCIYHFLCQKIHANELISFYILFLDTNSKKSENVIDLDGFDADDDDDALFAQIEIEEQSLKKIENQPSIVVPERQVFLENRRNIAYSPEKIDGFDDVFGKNYIYPTNYPIRDYQFNIIKKALLENTLVVLPTGLGKTFIAAVVMYNFYRWYPQRKLIFMAPTKPLVAQQIQACHNIMGISQNDTVEMTGM